MDTLCLIFINSLSLLLLAIILIFWVKVRRCFLSSVIFDLICYIASVKVFLLFILPAILRSLSDWAKDRLIGATPTEIALVYDIEFASIITWLLFMMLTLRFMRFGNESYSEDLKKGNRGITEKTVKVFIFLICIIFLAVFPYNVESAVELMSGGGGLIQPVVAIACPVFGIYVFACGRKQYGILLFVVGMIVTAMSMAMAFGGGSRGQIIFAALWLLFLYFFVTKKKYILYCSVAGILTVLLAYNIMTDFRSYTGAPKESYFEKASNMLSAVSGTKNENGLLSSMEFRFGEASRVSVGFLRLVDQGASAGLKPIAASLYSVIPRRYFQDKPLQGSVDGTEFGMGMRIIHIIMYGSMDMSEFYTGVHAYWELGIMGVFLFSALSGVFIALCIVLFGRLGSAGPPLMMIMLKPPWLEPKLWISEVIADIFHTLIPLLLIWLMCSFLVKVWCRMKNQKVEA